MSKFKKITPLILNQVIKRFNIKILMVFAITVLLFISSSSKVQAQVFPIILADSVEKFSQPQQFLVSGQLVKVRTKLIKHFGTTCVFEVEVTNISEKDLKKSMGFVSTNGNANEIYSVNSASIRLKPNYYAVYKLEKRECLKRGKKNPIESCMACNPRIGFL